MWDNFQRIIEHFTQKIVKIWSWDPGSGRRNKPIPDPGVKKAPDPGAVLSLTVDKVIQSSLFQAPALSRDGSRAAGSNSCSLQYSPRATAATGAIFSLSEKKELGKGGGGVESSGDQGFFLFFFRIQDHFWCRIRSRDPEQTHSGSRIQGSKRNLIPDPDPH